MRAKWSKEGHVVMEIAGNVTHYAHDNVTITATTTLVKVLTMCF